MAGKVPYILFFLLLLKVNNVCSQDLTGTWEGDLDNSEFLQVNIVQVKNNLCGYTWDYLYDDNRDYCKAYFTGRYDENRKQWILTGTNFFANSGKHVLMRLLLTYKVIDGEMVLVGKEISPTGPITILSAFLSQDVYLQKVSNRPAQMLDNMRECVKTFKQQQKMDRAKLIKPVAPAPKMITPVKPPAPPQKITTTTKPVAPIGKKVMPVKPVQSSPVDSIKKITSPVIPPVIVKDSVQLFTLMNKRKNTETSHLIVHEKNIRLEVFDNGIVDSDTVSVFYNGKLILSHKKLSEKAIVIPITLDEKISVHEIILFAENLGSIPPNTALVVVHAGDKRYELYASASLTENAVIRFEYKPK